MFDRFATHHHHHETRIGGGTTHVHEHRAPTDESIRLAQEMEEKVLAKILGSVRLEGVPFDCVVHHMRHYGRMTFEYVIEYAIGTSARRRVRGVFDRFDAPAPDFIATALVKALSEDIAVALLSHALPRGLANFRI